MAGRLEVYTGGMFAEKTTHLIRQGKRHMLAGRNVVFLKPAIDNRYSHETVMTHDGIEIDAINISTGDTCLEEVHGWKVIDSAEVVCIDEVQFFHGNIIHAINFLLKEDKKVYVAGLDMDRFGNPFGVVPHLMAIAEKVTKVHAVCGFCGEDAWLSLGTDNLNNNNQVNVGNEYIPACRSCVEIQGGTGK